MSLSSYTSWEKLPQHRVKVVREDRWLHTKFVQ